MRRKISAILAVAVVATVMSLMSPSSADAECAQPPRQMVGRPIKTDIFACAGLVADLPLGAFTGPNIRIPLSAGAELVALGYIGANWGKIERSFGKETKEVKETRMRAFVKSHDVPWPNANSKTAKKHRDTRYNVYQIWYTDP